MMFLTITSRISNSFSACFGKQQKPFEELSLAREEVRKIAEEIFDKGYASIPWSEATRAFVQKYKQYHEENFEKGSGFAVTRDYETGKCKASYHFTEQTVTEAEFRTQYKPP